jgi:hypothetical protein
MQRKWAGVGSGRVVVQVVDGVRWGGWWVDKG